MGKSIKIKQARMIQDNNIKIYTKIEKQKKQ